MEENKVENKEATVVNTPFAGWFRVELNPEARHAIGAHMGLNRPANRKDIRDFFEKSVAHLGSGSEAEVTTGTVTKESHPTT